MMRSKSKIESQGVKHRMAKVGALVNKPSLVLVGALVSRTSAEKLLARAGREGISVSQLIRKALGL